MKKSTLLLVIIFGLFAISAFAQNGPPPDGPRPDGKMGPPPDGPPNGQRPGDRGNLLRELGLSPEQFQQIRRMNQARKPIMEAAHQRMEEANRALDEAIYSDTLNEQEIQNRLKEAQLAQADLIKLRVMNELEVRKILTPEQLVKFRELREKFERMRENMKNRIDDRRPMQQQPPPQNGQPLRAPMGRPGARPGF